MKKAIAFFMASFYLLITTGMFICLIHCGIKLVASDTGMQMRSANKNAPMKRCNEKEDCNCCKTHGTYVVKENLKPGNHFGFDIPVFLNASNYLNLSSLRPAVGINSRSLIADGSPPGASGKEISIKLHSLQV